ncbi:MAG: ABC transporter ATP-binding protein [Propionibacteriaceae bacterium]|jgi:peptide/nickel transport system ATP-binding protein|nr:ABC transporter ATP-binding protein [Propionibacteriaceae bacterium]
MTAVFTVDHVSQVFQPRRSALAVVALDDVSLTVGKAERWGIVGESGSGKTTLLRLLAGLERPTSGAIAFEGAELTPAGRDSQRGFQDRGLRSRVQLVFQDPRSSLDPRMTVGAIVAEPLRGRRRRAGASSLSRPDRAARTAEVLAAVGLSADAARRYPHELSGGQRQRVAIARALAPNPDILLADEPVSALDVSVRAQILNLLTDLVAQMGLTLVLVSHDLGVVRHLCDRVAVLQHGRIVETGPTEQIYARPRQPYTQELLAAVPRLPAVLPPSDERKPPRPLQK